MSFSKYSFSHLRTLIFMVLLSGLTAMILSFVVVAFRERQEEAKAVDRNKQLLIAARVMNHDHSFLLYRNGEYLPAYHIGKGVLELGKKKASFEDIIEVYRSRVTSAFVTPYGEESETETPLPVYIVRDEMAQVMSYVFPVQGFGLWDKLVGYIAIDGDGQTIIGISWYEEKETPGLGGMINDPVWQNQFFGKKIFLPDEKGMIDVETSRIGILVVKGTVAEIIGDTPQAINAVDGVAGATMTSMGVARAYHRSLEPYRAFLKRLSKDYDKRGGT